MHVLRLRNLCFRYSKNTKMILEGVNYTFEEGKIYAIVGQSGSGKTTLLNLMAGLMKPREGEVYFDEQKIALDDTYRREITSMIHQNYLLFPKMTALENVLFAIRLKHGKKAHDKKKAEQWLSLVALDKSLYHHFPSQLSGGEQQRVAIARCLALETPVLVADEPTGNLDEDNTTNIIALLSTIAHQEHKCVIVVTHNRSVARACDITLHLKNSTLEEEYEAAF